MAFLPGPYALPAIAALTWSASVICLRQHLTASQKMYHVVGILIAAALAILLWAIFTNPAPETAHYELSKLGAIVFSFATIDWVVTLRSNTLAPLTIQQSFKLFGVRALVWTLFAAALIQALQLSMSVVAMILATSLAALLVAFSPIIRGAWFSLILSSSDNLKPGDWFIIEDRGFCLKSTSWFRWQFESRGNETVSLSTQVLRQMKADDKIAAPFAMIESGFELIEPRQADLALMALSAIENSVTDLIVPKNMGSFLIESGVDPVIVGFNCLTLREGAQEIQAELDRVVRNGLSAAGIGIGASSTPTLH